MSALGSTIDDPWSEMLQTNVRRFSSPHGIDGQYWIEGEPEVSRLNLLTIVATEPSTGQCKRFIEACKQEFDSVGVWEVWNDGLCAALSRWGFLPAEITHSGEKVSGYIWRRDV